MNLIGRKFICLTIMPVFLLAHLFCACSFANIPTASDSRCDGKADADGCCDDSPGPSSHDTPADTPTRHDCPHCATDGQIASASPRIQIPQAGLSHLPCALSAQGNVNGVSIASAQQAYSLNPWLTDPSPPPDLLQVKCTLQI